MIVRSYALGFVALIVCFAGCATSSSPDTNYGAVAGGAGTPATGGAAAAGASATAGVASAGAGASGIGAGAGASGAIGQTAGAGGASSASGGAGPGGAGGAGAGGTAGSSAGAPSTVPNAIETIQVPGNGQPASSAASLDNGELFLLKASGAIDASGVAIDAEYGGFAGNTAGQDSVSGTDVGIDVGFKVERTPSGTTAGRKKWFGRYRTDHTYYVIVTGAGAPLSVKLVLPAGSMGAGSIALAVLRLSPTAPALAAALDTIAANVTKQTAHSTLTPNASAVYLLQATGSGKCGGNNLGQGDADWMDYAADGTGKVDIGDQNVDYGLGVDEADPKVTPRARWWGPWRKDHSYFMLYQGTGTPIAFSYYDVGDYGDNSATDKITVKVLPVP